MAYNVFMTLRGAHRQESPAPATPLLRTEEATQGAGA